MIANLAWSPEDVLAIAKFVDNYLSHSAEYASKAGAVYSLKASVVETWALAASAKDNPYIATTRLAALYGSMRTLISTKQDELMRLEKTNPVLFNEVVAFQRKYNEVDDLAMRDTVKRTGGESQARTWILYDRHVEMSPERVATHKAVVEFMLDRKVGDWKQWPLQLRVFLDSELSVKSEPEPR
jgi:hypothetical protein